MKRTLLLSLTAFLLFSCASTGSNPNEPDGTAGISPTQQDLVDSADWALGRTRLAVKDKEFNLDCSGVILAIYYRSGIDLTRNLGNYRGGGVQRLYSYLKDLNLLYMTDYPAPGDLLFWDDTYDKNQDGRINDKLTHVGMVVRSDSLGNVSYIHHNYREGIVLASMNLLYPDDPSYNSPMRARNAEPGHAPRWLSSHLLNKGARAYEIPAL